jgi:hypothetical protein
VNRLTLQERRRLTLNGRPRTVHARLTGQPAVTVRQPASAGLGRAVRIMMALTLLAGAVAVFATLEFHMPSSLVEALLPRL